MKNISKLLQAKIENKHIFKRKGSGGKSLSYIKGSRMEMIANEIFDNKWSSETLQMEMLFSRNYKKDEKEMIEVAYSSKVRVKTIIDGVEVVKEGTGFGNGKSGDYAISSAYELAIKEAETDALKRALKKFGTAFGLELWDTKIDISKSYEKDLKMNEDLVLAIRKMDSLKDTDSVKKFFREYKGVYKHELATESIRRQKELENENK